MREFISIIEFILIVVLIVIIYINFKQYQSNKNPKTFWQRLEIAENVVDIVTNTERLHIVIDEAGGKDWTDWTVCDEKTSDGYFDPIDGNTDSEDDVNELFDYIEKNDEWFKWEEEK